MIEDKSKVNHSIKDGGQISFRDDSFRDNRPSSHIEMMVEIMLNTG